MFILHWIRLQRARLQRVSGYNEQISLHQIICLQYKKILVTMSSHLQRAVSYKSFLLVVSGKNHEFMSELRILI